MTNETQIRDKCQKFISDLKAIRESKGISTYDIERSTGLKSNNISRMEGGAYMPNLLTLMRYAEALGVEISVK
jgi:transcriptional regulator with XRE-family HTH domain